ncbi:MAG: recombinase family protein [Chloroflexi bacterium]|nr:recombinase family protein [Chloroflexota bacterium]
MEFKEQDGKPIHVAIYCRVSSEEQRDNQTIETQVNYAKKWIELQELSRKHYLVYDFYKDDGVSGTIALAKRPEGKRLLADAEAGRFSIVLAYKIDRMGRDPRDILNSAHRLDQLSVGLKSLTEDFDLTSPSGRFMFNIFAASAGFARDTQVERSVEGTNYWAKEGVWLGGIVPYGYVVEGRKKQARIAVNDSSLRDMDLSEADVVRLMYRLLTQDGWSCVKIAEHLNALGIPTAYTRDERAVKRTTPEGKRKTNTAGVWRPSRVRNLLVNSVYKGEHVYGKRSKKQRSTISREVPHIVTSDTWDAAQKTLRNNQIMSSKNAKRQYLLRGAVRCGICGLNYSGSQVKRAKGNIHIYYKCNGKQPFRGRLEGKCPSAYVEAERLESEIWKDIEGFIRNPGEVIETLAYRLKDHEQVTENAAVDRDVINAALNRKQSEKDIVIDLYRRDRITLPDLERQLEKISAEERELNERIVELDSQAGIQEDYSSRLSQSRELLSELGSRLDEGVSWDVKRQLVETLVLSVNVETVLEGQSRKPNVTVTYAFPGSADNRTGTDSWQQPA